MASKISRLSKAIAIAMLGLSLSGGNMPAVHASDADAELAALEAELAALESELAQEKGTIKEEKTKLKKEPNKLTLSGDARIKYVYDGNGARWYERGRIALKHDLSEKVSVYARWGLMNDNALGTSEHFAHKINTYIPNSTLIQKMYPDLQSTDGSWVSDANLQVKKFLGADKITIGRFGQTFGATGMMGDEDAFGGIDGAKLDWSSKVGALTIGFANFGPQQTVPELNVVNATGNSAYANGFDATGGVGYSELQRKPLEKALFVSGKVNLGPAVTLHGTWIKEMNNGQSKLIETGSPYTPYYWYNPNDYDMRGIGVTVRITPNLTLLGDYVLNACEHSSYLTDGATATTKSASAAPTNDLVADAKQHYKRFDFGRQKSEYISLRYKEAKWGDKGSFGINLDWRNIDPAARMDAYFTYTNNTTSNLISNDYYVGRNSLYNTLSIADDILVSEGVRGPVLGFNYMITKNVKLSILQTFAGKYTHYNLLAPHSRTKEGKGYTYNISADLDRVTEKADNMTVIALTAKF